MWTGVKTLAELVAHLDELGDAELFRYQEETHVSSLSYRQVARYTRLVVALLRQKGVMPGDRVLIWGPNTPQWATAFLGCFLAGVVPVPIDLRHRPRFLEEVRRQTEARLLFTSSLNPDSDLAIPTLQLEGLEKVLEEAEGEVEAPASVGEDDLAEILFTSGTTAQPKGVMLTHRNLLSELEAIQPIVPPEPYYLFLSILPLSHVIEQMGGLLLPISRGSAVAYLGVVKPAALLRALSEEHPTAMMVVPRFLKLLHDQVTKELKNRPLTARLFPVLLTLGRHLPVPARRRLFGTLHKKFGGQLKYLVCGGASLEPELESFWEATGLVILQGYGLTETASAVSCERVDDRRLGSVGKALPHQELRLAPDGEILVRGASVTPGYYGRPDLTAELFEEGWLKTGDLGRFDPDGHLYIKGRKKEVIVTSGGINVYPEDVEGVLARVAGVKDSGVVQWQEEVHAVLLLEEGVDPRQVVREANRHLDSSQKILGYTVWAEPDLPRTASLKVRRASLLEYLQQAAKAKRAA